MRRFWLGSLLLLLAAAVARADQPSLAAAAHAAEGGDYAAAVQIYERVLDQNGFSAPVLFNLGNAWLRLGKPARAILEYERARVLAPRSPAIDANLTAARERAGLGPETVGPWLATARYFSFDSYVWAALSAIWVLCGALVLLCLNGRARRYARPLILVAALTLCVSADAAALCWSDLSRAVVIQGPAVLHLAPAASAAASSSVREGEVVWLQERYTGFLFVRTADGHSGWISDAAAVPVRVSRAMTAPEEAPASQLVEVPAAELAPETLQALVESFVLREGTEYGVHEVPLATKVAQVMRQLKRGEAQIVFDPVTESVDIRIVPGLR